ncbi:MAG: hypothetical protein Q9220_000244 [cf. Caloplaca sp. 1 TL-2023]
MATVMFPFDGAEAQSTEDPSSASYVMNGTSAVFEDQRTNPRENKTYNLPSQADSTGTIACLKSDLFSPHHVSPIAKMPSASTLPENPDHRTQEYHHSSRGTTAIPLIPQVRTETYAGSQTRGKKKRNHKPKNVSALHTIRGFTPATSEDERSSNPIGGARARGSKKDLQCSSLSNVGLRSMSPGSGVSIITKQLEALQTSRQQDDRQSKKFKNANLKILTRSSYQRSSQSTPASTASELSPTASQSSATSDSVKDGEPKTVSYEVALEHDFISPDIGRGDMPSCDDTPVADHMVRKMTSTDFEPLRCLGKGTYGTVLLVKQAGTGRLFAQKQFRKASLTVKQHLIEQTNTERAILESINRHPYVVKLFYAFQDQEKLYLILEYAQGGELFTRMLTEGMFPEETAAFYMAEMVLALEHLHNTVGVVYRDLKPENCLLDAEGHLLLTDFGLSKVAVHGDYRCRSMTGTLEYMAPEVILQQNYGPEIDWWSFAVLGFEMLAGNSPFHAKNDSKIREKILKSKLVLPFFMSIDAKDLLTRMLRKKPKERLGARLPKDLQVIKSHRLFRRIDWGKLEKRQLEPPFKPVVTDPELAENFAVEFTDLAVSPVTMHPKRDWGMDRAVDPFGGFSFVASRSLLTAPDGFFF